MSRSGFKDSKPSNGDLLMSLLDENLNLRNRNKKLAKKTAVLTSELDYTKKQLTDARQQLAEVKSSCYEMHSLLSKQAAEITALKQELGDCRAQISKLRQQKISLDLNCQRLTTVNNNMLMWRIPTPTTTERVDQKNRGLIPTSSNLRT